MAARWAVDSRAWSPCTSEFERVLELLPRCERQAVVRFVKLEDRKRALLSRLLQRTLVCVMLGIPYNEVVISRSPEGKPFLVNAAERPGCSGFNFSVAHHGDYVVIVSDPVRAIGVDVMCHDDSIREQPLEYVANFRSVFTDSEWLTITGDRNVEDVLSQFYRHWCMKEAYVKAIGLGLQFDLKRIELFFPCGDVWAALATARIDGAEAAEWSFSIEELPDKHWVCVAVRCDGEILEDVPFKLITPDELVALTKT